MSRNIGFTKKEAEELVENLKDLQTCDCEGAPNIEAYAQKQSHWNERAIGKICTHEYIVVLRKRRER